MDHWAEQEAEFTREFKAIDSDGDGQLTREEYTRAFVEIWGATEDMEDPEYRERMLEFALSEFDGLDLDGNGTIDLSEFLFARTETNAVSEDYLAFLELDKDGNGQLTFDELMPDQVEANSPKAAEYLGRKAALERVDQDGDGKVSLDEWLAARKEERRRAREARRQSAPI